MGSDPSIAEVDVEFASRPDDSPLRCAFEPLSEKDLTQRLTKLAKPERTVFDAARGRLADAIAFQPCLRYSSQDRFVMQQIEVHGQRWTFTGVFDGAFCSFVTHARAPIRALLAGHLGDATVAHTAHHLPIIVKEFLHKVITGPAAPAPGADFMRELLSDAITAFDNAIAGDVLELFPGGIASLADRTDEEIQEVVNDFGDGRGAGANYQKARLCLYGTTALVALVDPAHENLWVANLGDCEAGTSMRHEKKKRQFY